MKRIVLLLAAACAKDVTVFQGNDFSTDPSPMGPLSGHLVTTNNGEDTLSAVTPALKVDWTIPVGFIPVELEGPHHVAVDPAGEFLYFNLSEAVVGSGTGPHGSHGTGTQPGYVIKIRTKDSMAVGQTRVDPNPGDLTISSDGKTLYVTHYDLLKWEAGAQAGDLRQGDANVAIIDAATMRILAKVPICPAPHGVRLSADGKTLYTTCGPDEMGVLDLTTSPPTASRVLLPGSLEEASCNHCPYAIGVAPDRTVWLSSLGPAGGGSGGGGVDVYDPTTGAFDPARHIGLCGRAVFTSFVPAGASYTAYVPEQGCGDSVDVFAPDASSLGKIAIPAADCLNAHMMTFAGADTSTGYLICEGDHTGPGSMVSLDLPGKSVLGHVDVGVFPDGVGWIP